MEPVVVLFTSSTWNQTISGPAHCFLDNDTLPMLLGNGGFQTMNSEQKKSRRGVYGHAKISNYIQLLL